MENKHVLTQSLEPTKQMEESEMKIGNVAKKSKKVARKLAREEKGAIGGIIVAIIILFIVVIAGIRLNTWFTASQSTQQSTIDSKTSNLYSQN